MEILSGVFFGWRAIRAVAWRDGTGGTALRDGTFLATDCGGTCGVVAEERLNRGFAHSTGCPRQRGAMPGSDVKR
jgi:hypothetical protein